MILLLEINKEFRKGILFVRIKGMLTKDTVAYLNKEVTKMVAEMKICNVVFNISELDSIDIEGINALFYNYSLCKNENGIGMLCGVDSKFKEVFKNSLVKDMLWLKNEIQAINMVEV